jgi:hypothetical protein
MKAAARVDFAVQVILFDPDDTGRQMSSRRRFATPVQFL